MTARNTKFVTRTEQRRSATRARNNGVWQSRDYCQSLLSFFPSLIESPRANRTSFALGLLVIRTAFARNAINFPGRAVSALFCRNSQYRQSIVKEFWYENGCSGGKPG